MLQLFQDNFIQIFITLFGTGGVIMYVLERKKHRQLLRETTAHANQEENAAVKSMQEAYNEFVKDQKDLYDSLKEDVILLKAQIKTLKNNLTSERRLNADLEVKYKKLNRSYLNLKKSYDLLKKQFDNYRQKKQ